MEKYLVKSIKWTENDKIETWWGANRNGYTQHIYQAGIYTKEEAESIEKDCRTSVAKAIKIDNEIKEKGAIQLNNLLRVFENEKQRYERNIANCEKHILNTREDMDKYLELMKGID